MQNRSSRFGGAQTSVPDPGAYEVKGTIGKKYNKGGGYSNKPQPRVSYTRRNNAAAIPSRHEVLGYEEDPSSGELRKADPGIVGVEALGPGSHNVPDPASGTSVYSGVNFGTRSTARCSF
jgi:hypothetical protein